MTEETTEQVDNLLNAEWLMTLPEVYRPIAQRYGKDAFIIAYAIGTMNETLSLIGQVAGRNATVKKALFFAISGSNNLATYAMLSKGLTTEKIGEIHLDIQRAAALSSATMSDGKGRIIVPS